MISPSDRKTYAPGEMIHAPLRIRWEGEFDAVVVESRSSIAPSAERSGTGSYHEPELEGVALPGPNPAYMCADSCIVLSRNAVG